MTDVFNQAFSVTDHVAPTIKGKFEQIALAADKAALAEARFATKAVQQLSIAAAAADRYAASSAASRSKAAASSVASNNKAAISSQRLAQEELRTAATQDKAALSALRLASARDRAAAAATKQANADKSASRAQMLGGIGAAVGGGIGGISGAIKGAAIGGISSGNPASMAIGATTLAATAGIGAIVEYGDAYAGLQNSLKNVTGSLETTGPLMYRLNEIAMATRSPLDAVAEGFARFHRALTPLGKSQEEVMGFQETLNTMLFQYGKTGAEAASATLQLTQAMGKGKLDGDEFRSVMENLPELGSAIAKELGVMKGELIELAPKGAITGEVIFNAMMHAKEGLDALPDPAARVEGGLTAMGNAATLFFGEMDKSLGITAALTGALTSLAEALSIAARRKAEFAQSEIKLGSADAADKKFNVPEELRGNAAVVEARDRLLKKEQDIANFSKGAHRGNIAQRTKQLEIDRADYVAAQEQYKLVVDGEKAKAQAIKHTAEVADKATRDAANKKPKGGGGSAADRHEKAYQAELLQLRQEYVELGIQEYESGIQAQGVALSKAQLDAEKDIAKELVRQFDQQLALNDAQDKHLMRAERLAILHEAMADSIKRAAETPAIGYAADPTSQTGISSIEEARLDEQTGVAANMRKRNAFLGESGEGNAAGEDMWSGPGTSLTPGVVVDLDKFRKEREEANKRTADNDPYLAKKDLDKRTEQLGDYGTDFEFQAQAREALYARIDELRQKDLLNEQEVSNARMRVWQMEQQSKLQLAESFFSNFTGLMASGNKEAFAIGQAAAIANATINTYQAANAAFAAMAGIPIVGPALGAAAAAAAVASGLVNVANIASQQPAGFKDGGYTGDIPANQVAGVVHGGEYVIDAANTARIGRSNLDAMNSGGQPAATGGGAPQTLNLMVAVFDSREAADAATPPAGFDKMVMASNQRQVKQLQRLLKAG